MELKQEAILYFMIRVIKWIITMAIKVLVTFAGHNALTETDKDNFIFNSDYNTFKILETGTITFDIANGATTTDSASHSIGYAPGFTGYLKKSDGSYVLPIGVRYWTANGTVYYAFIDMYTTDAAVYVTVKNTTGATITVTVKYYLFETPL